MPGGPPRSRYDVIVVGGGVVGLACAWRLSLCDMSVMLADPAPGRGASWAAAGMLAPVTELHHGEEDLLALNLAGAAMWGQFARDLEAASGMSVGYRQSGTLLVALDEGDRSWARELFELQQSLGLGSQWLTRSEARAREPALAPGISAALWAPDDHQVDNRLVIRSLAQACRSAGVDIVERAVAAVSVACGEISGVWLGDGPEGNVEGDEVGCDAVVLSAGCHLESIGGIADAGVPHVRPVKGQILRLDAHHAPGRQAVMALGSIVRGLVQGSSVYLVPRSSGELVVGATSEEMGFDSAVTAGAVYELLREAHRIVPGVTELAFKEATAGLRPSLADNAPAVGPTRLPGLVMAGGHYRNGVLLSPITSLAVVSILEGKPVPAEIEPYGLGRFARLG